MSTPDKFLSGAEREIFSEALTKTTPQERAAFVDSACGNNLQLRNRVEELLRHHTALDSFMADPAVEMATLLAPACIAEGPGTRIGRYKLLQQIGEGGMGVVYMAEQEEPVRRRVALKIIKLGMDTRQVIARFEAERQALALMDHPNIAKVLDAGATDTGRPYFVMELVRGVPLTDYCDKNHLETRERLELFIPVCQAIQHAHQKGVIHRDIKPSNVMVTIHDGRPLPMVIDFGIAKAINQRLTEKTLFTHYAQMVGTPAYMSPEQAEMSKLDVDTRTDVYSLGVLLYELLTGTTPFTSKELLEAGYVGMQRLIAEKEPPRPSNRLSTMVAEERTVVARNRRMEAARLSRFFQGDLDCIVMKTLEKDRNRRYDTAVGLATDIQHLLDDRPIIAKPPSPLYLSQKFLKRRKREALSAILLFALLLTGLGTFYQDRHVKALKVSQGLAVSRQEESRLLTRVIGGLPLSESDTANTRACVARLAARVKSGESSDADRDLLARFMARKCRLGGRAIQTLDSHLYLDYWAPSDFPVEGLGIVVQPSVEVESTRVALEAFPVYQSGSARNVGLSMNVLFRPAVVSAGVYEFSCLLEVQLVHDKKRREFRSKADLAEFHLVGTPVRIVLPVVERTFVQELPPNYPVEVRDESQAKALIEGVTLTSGSFLVKTNNRCEAELTITVPCAAHALPIALAVELVRSDQIPLQGSIASLIGSATHMFSAADGRGIETFGTAIGFNGEAAEFQVRFVLPGIQPAQMQSTSTLEIVIRSDREAALKSDNIENFLKVPDIRRTVSLKKQ